MLISHVLVNSTPLQCIFPNLSLYKYRQYASRMGKLELLVIHEKRKSQRTIFPNLLNLESSPMKQRVNAKTSPVFLGSRTGSDCFGKATFYFFNKLLQGGLKIHLICERCLTMPILGYLSEFIIF